MSSLVLTVHRAADQIGGNCIELEVAGQRLLLDAGTPLDAGRDNPVPPTLDTARAVTGVVISHPHQDHFGLLDALPDSWPVWTGGPSEALIRLTGRLSGRTLRQPVRRFESFTAFSAGPFTVTPLLTDHSAFDAHMLLIEAAGRRVLYSGDFQAGARFAQIHTSGHASRDDLLALARRIRARALVPIHSFDWDDHADAFPRVLRLRDGEPHRIR